MFLFVTITGFSQYIYIYEFFLAYSIIFYSLSKLQVKKLVQDMFDVKVTKINTYILPKKIRKVGKFRGYKGLNKRVILLLVWIISI